jgi:predicted molibdopterin-dependent oxidoreductase YjgC
MADVVLPSQTFAARRGTYTNLERRVQLLRPALGPTDDEEADWRTICQIARRMGVEGFDYSDEEQIFDELNSIVPFYGGISYRRLEGGGLQWPCLAADMADTSDLYAGAFERRKARFAEVSLVDAPSHDDDAYPLLLAHGRVLHQPEKDVDIVDVDGRNAISRPETVTLHVDDAEKLGISDGDRVDVESPRGTIVGVASLAGPLQGIVNVTTLFGQLIWDLERSDDPDPMLRAPTLPLLPVRLLKPTAAVAAD